MTRPSVKIFVVKELILNASKEVLILVDCSRNTGHALD